MLGQKASRMDMFCRPLREPLVHQHQLLRPSSPFDNDDHGNGMIGRLAAITEGLATETKPYRPIPPRHTSHP